MTGYALVLKFNKNHDKAGRFAAGGGLFSMHNQLPLLQLKQQMTSNRPLDPKLVDKYWESLSPTQRKALVVAIQEQPAGGGAIAGLKKKKR